MYKIYAVTVVCPRESEPLLNVCVPVHAWVKRAYDNVCVCVRCSVCKEKANILMKSAVARRRRRRASHETPYSA